MVVSPDRSAADAAAIQTLGTVRSRCASMQRLFGHIRDIAQSDAAVLLLGESGVGKERLGRTLHEVSPRRGRRLVVLVCTGMSAARLRSALYGDEPGATFKRAGRAGEAAAPGAVDRAGARASGALGQASGGTLLLDDVAALDADAQSELLRALNSEPSVQREPARRARVRLLATTTDDIAKLVRLGRFRPDLYHRLAAARLEVPPLRERRDDVPLLAEDLLATAATRHQRCVPTLHPEALALLNGYPWPGNVRELADVMELALLRSRGPVLQAADLAGLLYSVPVLPRVEIPLGWTLAAAEREVILQTLAAHSGNRQETADTLAISRRTLYEKLARYKAQDGTALRPTRSLPTTSKKAARKAAEPPRLV